MMKLLLLLFPIVLQAQTIEWAPVENAEGYRINFDLNNEGCTASERLPYSVDVGNNLGYELTQDPIFVMDQEYKFQISAYTHGGRFSGPLSEEVYCLTIGNLDVIKVSVKKKSK